MLEAANPATDKSMLSSRGEIRHSETSFSTLMSFQYGRFDYDLLITRFWFVESVEDLYIKGI